MFTNSQDRYLEEPPILNYHKIASWVKKKTHIYTGGDTTKANHIQGKKLQKQNKSMGVTHTGILESNGASISNIYLQCKKIHIMLFYLYKAKDMAICALLKVSVYLCEVMCMYVWLHEPVHTCKVRRWW